MNQQQVPLQMFLLAKRVAAMRAAKRSRLFVHGAHVLPQVLPKVEPRWAQRALKRTKLFVHAIHVLPKLRLAFERRLAHRARMKFRALVISVHVEKHPALVSEGRWALWTACGAHFHAIFVVILARYPNSAAHHVRTRRPRHCSTVPQRSANMHYDGTALGLPHKLRVLNGRGVGVRIVMRRALRVSKGSRRVVWPRNIHGLLRVEIGHRCVTAVLHSPYTTFVTRLFVQLSLVQLLI
mmetsp:Transcript_15026/g.40295  ORF Transcript_15026/g.40295 Transcript_15026/m.40295 type:complete len:238 (+) Transcript_15026:371-1084(+)